MGKTLDNSLVGGGESSDEYSINSSFSIALTEDSTGTSDSALVLVMWAPLESNQKTDLSFSTFKVTKDSTTISNGIVKNAVMEKNEYNLYQTIIRFLPSDNTYKASKGDVLKFSLSGKSSAKINNVQFYLADNSEAAGYWKQLSGNAKDGQFAQEPENGGGNGSGSDPVSHYDTTLSDIYGTWVIDDLNVEYTYNTDNTYVIKQADIIIEEGEFDAEEIEEEIEYYEDDDEYYDEEDDEDVDYNINRARAKKTSSSKKKAKKTTAKKTEVKQKATKSSGSKASQSTKSKGSTSSSSSSSTSSSSKKSNTTETKKTTKGSDSLSIGSTPLSKKGSTDESRARSIYIESTEYIGVPWVSMYDKDFIKISQLNPSKDNKGNIWKKKSKAAGRYWYLFKVTAMDSYKLYVGTNNEFTDPIGRGTTKDVLYLSLGDKTLSRTKPASIRASEIDDDNFVGNDDKYYLVGNFIPDSNPTGKFFTGSKDSKWEKKYGYNNMKEISKDVYEVTLYLPMNTFAFKVEEKNGSHSYMRNPERKGFIRKNEYFAVTKAEKKTDGRNFAISTGGGLYTFTLDLSESTPKLCVTTNETDDSAYEDDSLYIVGSMNGWCFDENNGLLNETVPESGIWNGKLTVNDTTVDSDYQHTFKITDKAWGGIYDEYATDDNNPNGLTFYWSRGEYYTVSSVYRDKVDPTKITANKLEKGTYLVSFDTTKTTPKLHFAKDDGSGSSSTVYTPSYTNNFDTSFDVTLTANATSSDPDSYKMQLFTNLGYDASSESGYNASPNKTIGLDFSKFKVTCNNKVLSNNLIKQCELEKQKGDDWWNYQATFAWLDLNAGYVPKAGDTLHFEIAGSCTEQTIDLYYQIADNTEEANWWKVLADFGNFNLSSNNQSSSNRSWEAASNDGTAIVDNNDGTCSTKFSSAYNGNGTVLYINEDKSSVAANTTITLSFDYEVDSNNWQNMSLNPKFAVCFAENETSFWEILSNSTETKYFECNSTSGTFSQSIVCPVKANQICIKFNAWEWPGDSENDVVKITVTEISPEL